MGYIGRRGEAYHQPTQEAGKCVCLPYNIQAAKFSILSTTEIFHPSVFPVYDQAMPACLVK